MSGSTKDDINKATDATEYHPPAPEAVARDAETVRGALSLLTSNDVGQRTEGFAALSRLATAAARVQGLEAKVKDLGEQYEADRYEIHGILMWAGEWGTRAPKPSRHVTALLERLRTAESERDAARQKMDAWCRIVERERAAAQEDVDSYARRVERVESALREEREKTAELTARVAELGREKDALNICLADSYQEHVLTPVPAGLLEAVGYALERLEGAKAHPNVVAKLRAAYDAATGGAR